MPGFSVIRPLAVLCSSILLVITSFLISEIPGDGWSPAILVLLSAWIFNFKSISSSASLHNDLITSLILIWAAVILYVWPLFPSLIRVDDPYASFDAQKYSLSAKLILETGRGLGHWLSAGIDKYLVFIYRNFGVNEVNVIAFNCIIFLASIKLLSGVFKENTYIPSSLIILLATPLTTFYVIQPSKKFSACSMSLF